MLILGGVIRDFFSDEKQKEELLNRMPPSVRNKDKNNIPIEKLPTREEMSLFIKYCTCDRDRAIVSLLYDTGLRIGELTRLQVEDVHLEDSRPYVMVRSGKTGQRKVRISHFSDGQAPFSPYHLDTWINSGHPTDTGYLFVSKFYQGQLNDETMRGMIKRLGQKVRDKWELHPHLFRHPWMH